MIGKIKGTLVEVEQNSGLIETNSGVFYQVFLPQKYIFTPPPFSIELYTYLQVREDALTLYGFETKHEVNLFKMLIAVSGVGPKSAYSILFTSKSEELEQAIKENDVAYFQQIPGLGKKTAMKIILELSQKMKESFELDKVNIPEEDTIVSDALVSLGYKSQEVKKILAKIPRDLSVEEKITTGIRILSQHPV